MAQPTVLFIPSPVEWVDFPAGDYRLVSAADTEMALELRPDLIVCAGCQPDVLIALRAFEPLKATPILVATGRADNAMRVQLLLSGAQEIVAPDSTEELQIRVDSILRNQMHNHSLTTRIAEVNQELDALTYSISHDLRAPLRAVNGFSDVLIGEYGEALGPEGQRLLERVQANAARVSQMVEDLLGLSRLVREPFQPTRLDVTALVGQLAARLRQGQPSRSVELIVADGLSAWGDARLVLTLWEHLLDNAWKFNASKVEVGQVDGVFFVRDNGVGYDMQYADRLFAPFQRLHGRDYAGRGVGLAAAARIVARHGGRIWAEAAVDKGATIFLTLAPAFSPSPPPGRPSSGNRPDSLPGGPGLPGVQ